MPSIKRLVALLAAATLAAAGCGSNQGGSGAASGAPASQAPAVSPSAVSGTLTVWGMGAEGAKMNVLAEAFMKEFPDVKVTVTPVDWGQAVTKLNTAIGGRQTPDVSQMGTDMMGQFAATGALEATPSNFQQGTFYESAWNSVIVDGTAYGVPWYVETRALYYRTDTAEAAGITAAPTTWDELKATAKALKGQGDAEWGLSLGTKNWQEYVPFLWQNGGQIVTDDGQAALDSPEAVEALTFYDSFFEEELSPTSRPEGFDITPAFVAGTHPMFFDGPWQISLIADQGGTNIDGKWAVVPMPKKKTGTSFIGGGNLVVFKDSKNKDAAWAFVEFLSRPETQVLWYKEISALPAVQSAWEDAALSGDDQLKVFESQLEDTQAVPALATWSELSAALNENLEKVTAGDTPPEAGAKAMQEAAQKLVTGN
jgi:multiple sugar transport system substrate-binding protein